MEKLKKNSYAIRYTSSRTGKDMVKYISAVSSESARSIFKFRFGENHISSVEKIIDNQNLPF